MPSILIIWTKIKQSFQALLKNGTSSKKSTNPTSSISPKKLIKLITAIILSNIFFFMLFSTKEKEMTSTSLHGVEVVIEGKLLTSFEKNKEILLTHPHSGLKMKARLLSQGPNQDQYLILSSEVDALKILARPLQWNILPYLKNFTLTSPRSFSKEIDHEIHF